MSMQTRVPEHSRNSRSSVGTTEEEVRHLVKEGQEWISHFSGQQTISFSDESDERLRKHCSKGTLIKADINRRGYNKFFSISSGVTVSINEEKIREDLLCDGLKCYL